MSIKAASEQNRSSYVINWRVKEVEVNGELSLLVTFNDGTNGTVTLSPTFLTGVFSDLSDPETFNSVGVDHGAVTWSNGLDLDPKSMYDEIRSKGRYLIQ